MNDKFIEQLAAMLDKRDQMLLSEMDKIRAVANDARDAINKPNALVDNSTILVYDPTTVANEILTVYTFTQNCTMLSIQAVCTSALMAVALVPPGVVIPTGASAINTTNWNTMRPFTILLSQSHYGPVEFYGGRPVMKDTKLAVWVPGAAAHFTTLHLNAGTPFNHVKYIP